MTTIQQRRGTAAAWTSANPTLAAGEPGFETDTGKFKIGDGATAWTSLAYQAPNPMTTTNDIIIGGASGVPARLAKGSDGQVLTVDPTTHNLVWATPGGGSSPLTTKGDVWGFSTVDARIPIGSNAQVLTADSTQALGLKWATPGGGATSPLVGAPGTGAATGGSIAFADASGNQGGAVTITGGHENDPGGTNNGWAVLKGGTGHSGGTSAAYASITGGDMSSGNADGASVVARGGQYGESGGDLELNSGNAFDETKVGKVVIRGGTPSRTGACLTLVGSTNGKAALKTNNASGSAGEVPVSDGSSNVVWGGIKTGSGAPSGAPSGFLPIYYDTGTPGIYVWDGAAWQGPF